MSGTGYDGDATRENIPIGTGLTAIDLPDDTTIIIRANEATVLGEKANILFSESQMEGNGLYVRKTENGLRYLEVQGYVIPIKMKNAMYTIPIRKPTE